MNRQGDHMSRDDQPALETTRIQEGQVLTRGQDFVKGQDFSAPETDPFGAFISVVQDVPAASAPSLDPGSTSEPSAISADALVDTSE
jgi:hypothetical protein